MYNYFSRLLLKTLLFAGGIIIYTAQMISPKFLRNIYTSAEHIVQFLHRNVDSSLPRFPCNIIFQLFIQYCSLIYLLLWFFSSNQVQTSEIFDFFLPSSNNVRRTCREYNNTSCTFVGTYLWLIYAYIK